MPILLSIVKGAPGRNTVAFPQERGMAERLKVHFWVQSPCCLLWPVTSFCTYFCFPLFRLEVLQILHPGVGGSIKRINHVHIDTALAMVPCNSPECHGTCSSCHRDTDRPSEESLRAPGHCGPLAALVLFCEAGYPAGRSLVHARQILDH